MTDAGLMKVSKTAFSTYVRIHLGSALAGSVSAVPEDQMSDQERRLLGKVIPQGKGRKPVDDSNVKYG